MAAALKLVSSTAPASREQMLEALQESEPVRRALAEKQALIAARRKVCATELQKIEADALARWDRDQAAIDQALADVKVAEAALKAANQRVGLANQARSQASWTHSTRQNELESELLESASPALTEFITWTRDEHDKARRAPLLRTIEGGQEEDLLTGQRRRRSESNNRAAILARMDALRSAQHAAEDLRLAADQSAVEATIEKLKASIPKIGD